MCAGHTQFFGLAHWEVSKDKLVDWQAFNRVGSCRLGDWSNEPATSEPLGDEARYSDWPLALDICRVIRPVR